MITPLVFYPKMQRKVSKLTISLYGSMNLKLTSILKCVLSLFWFSFVFNYSSQATAQIAIPPSTANSRAVITYPVISKAQRSEVYHLTVNGISVFIEKYKNIHYACFAFAGTANLSLNIQERIQKYSISPESYDIEPIVEKNRIYFSLYRPRKLIVQLNHHERIFIFADPIEDQFQSKDGAVIIDIMDYIDDNIGETLLTNQIQKAIMAVPQNGILYFPPGIYLTGTISLKSNMTLYVAGGALLQGSPNRDDYPVDKGWIEADQKYRPREWTHNGEKMTYSRLLLVDNAQNVKITGRGIIDGNGKIVRNEGKPANLIRVRNSKNVVIEDLILRDSAAWNLHILHSENITVRNTKIINDLTVKNTDGINPDSSQNVLIENNFAYCGDDNVAIKSSNNSKLLKDVMNIVVRGNVFLTTKSSLKIGTETKAANMKNISFVNNDVVQSDRGMTIYCMDGAKISDVHYINNRFENYIENSTSGVIDFLVKRRSGRSLVDRMLAKFGFYKILSKFFPSLIGQIKNVIIQDCYLKVPWPNPSTFKGYDKKHTISDVHFENFVVAGKVCHNSEEANIRILDYVKNVTFSVSK